MNAAIEIFVAGLKLSEREYNENPAMRASLLKEILRSPAHFKHRLENPMEQTPAMALGSALHCFLLEPMRFHSEYVVAPRFDKRTRQGKIDAEAFEAEHAGKRFVTEDVYSTIQRMAKAVWSHPAAAKEIQGAEYEQSFFWRDAETGVECKARPDIVRFSDRVITEIKTTSDASLNAFQRQIANLNYHLQSAMQLEGASRSSGHRFEIHRTIAVETSAPFAVAVYETNLAALEKGHELFRKALSVYVECDAVGIWPSYSDEVQPISLPAWAWGDE